MQDWQTCKILNRVYSRHKIGYIQCKLQLETTTTYPISTAIVANRAMKSIEKARGGSPLEFNLKVMMSEDITRCSPHYSLRASLRGRRV